MKRASISGVLGVAAVAAAVPSLAQETPVPTPAPAPAPTRNPSVIFLPGAETFDLANPKGSATRATPPPAQTAPPPEVAPVAVPQPQASPTRAPAQAPAEARRPTPAPDQPRAAGTPAAGPEPAPVASPNPVAPPPAQPAPVPPSVATPVSQSAPAPAGMPGWLWMLIGGGIVALAGGAGAVLRRRQSGEAPEAPRTPVRAAPERPIAPPPPPPSPAARAVPIARSAPERIAVEFRPAFIEPVEGEAVLEFELLLANQSNERVEGLRIALALVSASPVQDQFCAAFHGSPGLQPALQPMDLAPGQTVRLPGRLALPMDRIHVVKLGERPMFVPLVLIDLRWRGGLSLRHQAVDLMVGAAGQGDKLGPIWLDRGRARQERLSASRYHPRPVPTPAAAE